MKQPGHKIQVLFGCPKTANAGTDRGKSLLLSCLLLLAASHAFGNDTNSLTQFITRSGQLYKSVQVVKTEPDGLLIQFAPAGGGIGIEKIKFEDLPVEIQQKYNYDPQKVIAYKKWQHDEQAKVAAKAKADQEQRLATIAKNTATLAAIVSLYHKTHVYIGEQTGNENNIYVCGDMACDVWDMVQKKGFPAVIAVGNPNKQADSDLLFEANHAWVMAETIPGEWLALEATGGYVVEPSQNRNYYTCISFRNPNEFHRAYELLNEYIRAWKKDYEARRAYNEILQKLTKGGDTSDLKTQLKEKAAVTEQRDADCEEIIKKLGTINK